LGKEDKLNAALLKVRHKSYNEQNSAMILDKLDV
jgi:hypothetical protein